MYRQGDVLVVPAEEVPVDARKADDCVVARGEVTGHAHRIASGAEQFVTPDGRQFVRVLAPFVDLVHEDHGALRLPGPGVYRIVHQREYVPGSIRRVRD